MHKMLHIETEMPESGRDRGQGARGSARSFVSSAVIAADKA